MSHEVTETCSCGATMHLHAEIAATIHGAVADFRINHRHEFPPPKAEYEQPASDGSPGDITTHAHHAGWTDTRLGFTTPAQENE